MSVILHLGNAQDCDSVALRCATSVTTSLAQQAIYVAVIVEHISGVDPESCRAYLSLKDIAGSFYFVQPSQVIVALQSVLKQGKFRTQPALALSLSDGRSNYLRAAKTLKCHTAQICSSDPYTVSLTVLQQFAQLMKHCTGCLVCGYVMKRSRQLSLCAEGMLPSLPQDGICFMPLDVNQRLDLQQPFDVLLQKPTDYLKNTEDDGNVPPFTADLLQLNTYVNERLVNVTVVDPLSHVHNVMDRALLGNMLAGVCHQACQAGVQLRCPKWHLLTDPLSMTQQCLEGVSMAPPIILKPKVACGIAASHQMSFLLSWSGLAGLNVPLPAIAQEYVDHGGVLWKVYVAGEKVFTLQRKSTPDLQLVAQTLVSDSDSEIPCNLNFDSLKSLPTDPPWMQLLNKRPQPKRLPSCLVARELPQKTAELVARLLLEQLQLTLFGFDLIINNTGETYIIDVNYFPSYKGLIEAPSALRDAILAKHKQHATKNLGPNN